jgi:hypothetical protein
MPQPGYTRIYNTPDGNSHFEDVTVQLNPVSEGAITPTSEASTPVPAIDFNIRRMVEGADSDWHPAPRRQFVIILAGTVEITASDGEVRRFGPADMFLADDLEGKHKTRPVDGGEAIIVTVPVADKG